MSKFNASLVGVATLALFAVLLLVAGRPVSAQESPERLRAVLLEISAPVFSRPHDLVLSPDGKFLYVADVGNDAVQVLDPRTLRVLGAIGADDLDDPHDVVFDKAGQLLVADSGNNRIVIYQVQGAKGSMAGELAHEALDSPEGVVEAPDGRVYVTSAGAHNVAVFTDGKKTGGFGSGGRGRDNYVRPHDIIVGGQGSLFVTDPGNNRIHITDAGGRLKGMLGAPDFSFNEPKYIALDERGRFYVADQHNSKIKIYNREYRELAVIPPASGGRAHRLNWPEGVTARDNRVWVSDTYNNLILLYELRKAR